MRFLVCSLLLLTACASDYKGLRATSVNKDCIAKVRPQVIDNSWFDTSIDVVGKHISGLLLIKHMPDSSSRVVFTNEAGVKFLDFEYAADGKFKVHHILEQLDKNAVVNLLQSDFRLIIGLPFKNSDPTPFTSGTESYFRVKDGRKFHYFITGENCAELGRIESGSARKRVTTLKRYGHATQPDSIHLQHHTFAMKMTLKKLSSR